MLLGCGLLLATPPAGLRAVGQPGASTRQADDLATVRQRYVLASKAFTPFARSRALGLIDAVANGPVLSAPELHLRLLEIAALSDNAHDRLSGGTDAARPDGRLPISIAWFPDALLIVRAAAPVADLAGARIESVEGVPVAQLYDRLLRYAGGVDSRRRLALAEIIEAPSLLRTAGLASRDDSLRLQVRRANGAVESRRITTVPAGEVPRDEAYARRLSPEALSPADATWVPAVPRTDTPLALRDAALPLRVEPVLGGAALYLQFREHVAEAGQDAAALIRPAVAAIELQRPVDLILDLRFDEGEAPGPTLEFVRSLPQRVGGRVYVLIGRYTFASGLVSAAAAKKAGGDRVVIVGESPGDRLRFWIGGGRTCLPHSGFCLHHSDGLVDLERGCRGTDGCYGDRFDATIGSLGIELAAPFTADDYLAGRDRALEQVLERLR